MDAFDTINLSVFSLTLFAVIARLTFGKGPPLRLGSVLIPLLTLAIGALTLSTVHHWNAPHRRTHQWWLAWSGLAVGTWPLTGSLLAAWQESRQKQEAERKRRAERRRERGTWRPQD